MTVFHFVGSFHFALSTSYFPENTLLVFSSYNYFKICIILASVSIVTKYLEIVTSLKLFRVSVGIELGKCLIFYKNGTKNCKQFFLNFRSLLTIIVNAITTR